MFFLGLWGGLALFLERSAFETVGAFETPLESWDTGSIDPASTVGDESSSSSNSHLRFRGVLLDRATFRESVNLDG